MAAQAQAKVNLLKVTQNTVQDFGKDDMGTYAGAITYFTFLALLPLAILAITIASFFFDTPEGRDNLTKLLAGAFSTNGASTDPSTIVNDAINNAVQNRTGAGIFSLVGLIFSASGIFGTLSNALTRAYEAKPTNQNFIINYLKNIASLGVAGVLIIAVNIATLLLTTIANGAHVINFFGLSLPGWVFEILNIIISVVLLWGVFILMYKFLPNTHVDFKDVFIGSLIGAIGWTLLKELFGFYLAHFGPQTSTYGSLTTVVTLLLYIYFASMILLLGAEFCSDYAKARQKLAVDQRVAAHAEGKVAPDRAKDPRYTEHERLARELELLRGRQQAREQAAAAPANAAIVGAPTPPPTRPVDEPLTQAAPVMAAAAGVAAGAAVIATAVSKMAQRGK